MARRLQLAEKLLSPLAARIRGARPRAIEIVAIVLAAVLVATYRWPHIFQQRGDAAAMVQEDLNGLRAALETYRYDVGTYPSTQQGLAVLVQAPPPPQAVDWLGPYVLPGIPLDPWGRAYVYRHTGEPRASDEGYVLTSFGSDGRPGGEGAAAADIEVQQ